MTACRSPAPAAHPLKAPLRCSALEMTASPLRLMPGSCLNYSADLSLSFLSVWLTFCQGRVVVKVGMLVEGQ